MTWAQLLLPLVPGLAAYVWYEVAQRRERKRKRVAAMTARLLPKTKFRFDTHNPPLSIYVGLVSPSRAWSRGTTPPEHPNCRCTVVCVHKTT
jgi:hypothetical protein